MSAPARTKDAARFQRIIEGPVLRTLMGLSLPVIAVITAQLFVSVLEAYWISRLGTAAVAGVSLVLPLFVLMGAMSNGGIGGGVSSAVARAIGAGRQEDAEALVFHAVVVALIFGTLFTAGAFLGGPWLYARLGGAGEALAIAESFSAWVFGGSIVIWTVNLLSSALRGSGEVRLPAIVSIIGAVLLIPLSPVLILGAGPFPGLGVAGSGIAMLGFYTAALVVYVRHLRSGRGGLVLRPTRLELRHFRSILGVGLISAVGTLMASLSVVAVTGAVGMSGEGALAGFGIASRIDSLLIPLLFGLGTGVVTMVGAATGAGLHARARRVAWTAAILAALLMELVGILVAIWPDVWMSIFSTEEAVLAAGATYLRVTGPFFGGIGLGLVLYFACQGRGTMAWPFVAGGARLGATAGGAYLLAQAGAPLDTVFLAVAAGSVLFGLINAYGFWASAVGTASATRPSG